MTAVQPQDAVLVIEFQGDVVRTIPLTNTVLKIGRSPANDLPLQHPGVSREHVELRLTPQGMVVTDLESSNGTYVDGARILAYQPTQVAPGQSLQIGPFILAIRLSPGHRS